MRVVHHWKCDCGTRIRVIADRIAAETDGARCPGCRTVVSIDGTVKELSVEKDETWIRVDHHSLTDD